MKDYQNRNVKLQLKLELQMCILVFFDFLQISFGTYEIKHRTKSYLNLNLSSDFMIMKGFQ